MTDTPHCSSCAKPIPRGMRGSIVNGSWLCPDCVAVWADADEQAEIERLAELYEAGRGWSS